MFRKSKCLCNQEELELVRYSLELMWPINWFVHLGTTFESMGTYFESMGTWFESMGTWFESMGTWFESMGTTNDKNAALLTRAKLDR